MTTRPPHRWPVAAAIAEAQGLSADPLCGIVHMALGRVLIRQGKLTEAQEQLEWALELFGIDSMAVHRAHVLLLLAQLDHVRGDLPGARTLLRRANEVTDRMAAGVLPGLLQQTRQRLGPAPRQRVKMSAPLTMRELAVLRLLPRSARPGTSATSSMCRSILSEARFGPSTASSA